MNNPTKTKAKTSINDETKFAHSGDISLPESGFVSTPIIQSSLFYREHPLEENEYEYSRSANPTRKSLENCIRELEGGNYGFCFSSGVAAIHAACSLLKSGEEIIFQERSYLGSNRIINFLGSQYGILVRRVNYSNSEAILNAITSKTKLIWIETPSNPLLDVVDLEDLDRQLKHKGIRSNIIISVDNTFATPFFQKPLYHGVDIVVHSASKYLGGHSDAILGALVCNDKTIANQIGFLQNAIGSIPAPMESFLVLRGIKTLHVRMAKHNENAILIAKYLNSHNKVEQVLHPSLNEKDKAVVQKQMTGYGGVISFVLKVDTVQNALIFLKNISLIKIAESLGGVESLATNPASVSHKQIDDDERQRLGVNDSLIRLSVGIENPFDLIQEIEYALDHCM